MTYMLINKVGYFNRSFRIHGKPVRPARFANLRQMQYLPRTLWLGLNIER